MKLTTNYPTLTYEVDGGFLISVIGNTSKCLWEAWIRISDYGIARHMFSIPMDGHPLEEFIGIFPFLFFCGDNPLFPAKREKPT